jgi:hypothetical protein
MTRARRCSRSLASLPLEPTAGTFPAKRSTRNDR